MVVFTFVLVVVNIVVLVCDRIVVVCWLTAVWYLLFVFSLLLGF